MGVVLVQNWNQRLLLISRMADERPPSYSEHEDDSRLVQNDAATSIDTLPDILIAIDFGTAFSGIAYLPTAILQGSAWDVREIAPRLTVYRQWPNAERGYADKIPTALLYDSRQKIAGWGLTRTSSEVVRTTVEYFKLGLEPSTGHHYRADPSGPAVKILGGFLSDPDWRHPELPEKSAVDFAADYLTQLHNHFLEEYIPEHYGREYREGLQFGYVMTVPEIWSQGAKDLVRQAAVRAAINNSSLELVSEPEAAALYCATLCRDADLGTGDRFVVCDAGGGTVVRWWDRSELIYRTLFHTRLHRKIHFEFENAPQVLEGRAAPSF